MKDKDKSVEDFVYVNARNWTGVDIEGALAVPVKEYMERWSKFCQEGSLHIPASCPACGFRHEV